MQSIPLEVEKNLSQAESLIVQAGESGAELVVLPEMFNVGFYFGEDLMTVAEALDGKTVSWLKSLAARHNIYIIGSLYERHEGHFYNTMVMVGSDGSLQRYRKRNPGWMEVSVWKRSDMPGPGIFETPFGRIGGAICFDTFTREIFEGFKQSRVELVVLIGCWGAPRLTSWWPDFLAARATLGRWSPLASEVVPYQYATQLDVPTVFVNQGGMMRSPLPPLRPGPLLPNLEYEFHGRSHVRNASGEVLISADGRETQFCAVVPVDFEPSGTRPEIMRVNIPPHYLRADYYFVQPPFLAKLFQIWHVRGLAAEYEARRARHTD